MTDAELRSVLTVAMQNYSDPEADRTNPFRANFNDKTWTVTLQDVSGMVDLNTANPALLERLLTNAGIENVAQVTEHYQNWRQEGNRLSRINDFGRIAEITQIEMEHIAPHVTIFSGRPGISIDVASMLTLELLTGTAGSRSAVASELPTDFLSPATGVNYVVNISPEFGRIFTVHLPLNSENAKVLNVK